VPCAYVDRRGRGCGAAFCPAHMANIGGRPYCRRHAGVVRGLAKRTLETEQGTEIDNRAPSLAEWMGNEVDEDLQRLLGEMRGPNVQLVLSAEPLALISQGTPRARSWERTWKLSSHTGIVIKIALLVDEADDSEVQARVDSELVFRGVPPWVARRSVPAGMGQDEATLRLRFRQQILDQVRAAVGVRGPTLQA
jgi:hypothetical protein